MDVTGVNLLVFESIYHYNERKQQAKVKLAHIIQIDIWGERDS